MEQGAAPKKEEKCTNEKWALIQLFSLIKTFCYELKMNAESREKKERILRDDKWKWQGVLHLFHVFWRTGHIAILGHNSITVVAVALSVWIKMCKLL